MVPVVSRCSKWIRKLAALWSLRDGRWSVVNAFTLPRSFPRHQHSTVTKTHCFLQDVLLDPTKQPRLVSSADEFMEASNNVQAITNEAIVSINMHFTVPPDVRVNAGAFVW